MLEILYRDEHLIAVNKPSGLLVHRSMIDRHETAFAIQILREQIGRYVYPLHRLDKPTSGVLLFALSKEAAQRMSGLIASRETSKTYLAVVRGYTDLQGHIDYPLKEQLDKITDRNARADKPAQEAVTDYIRLATAELPYPVSRYPAARYSLLRLTPHTGRKHQLRRHMKHIMHPIVGDTKHGRGEHNRLFREKFGCHRLLLHAQTLQFIHPYTGESLVIEAQPDETFLRILELFPMRFEIK